MSALLTGLFGDYVRRSLSMTNESNKIDGQEDVEFTPDFLGESRHEFVARLAYQHWEGRGIPLGSPETCSGRYAISEFAAQEQKSSVSGSRFSNALTSHCQRAAVRQRIGIGDMGPPNSLVSDSNSHPKPDRIL
jgi:hypothetical protein